MSYGAPTKLDLSACTVSSDGGKTSQTLAVVTATVGDTATAVARAQEDATDAKTAATQASADAAAATAAVGKAVLKTDVGAAGGVVALEAGGSAVIPVNSNNSILNFGYGSNTLAADGNVLVIYNGPKGLAQDFMNWMNPDGSANFGRYLDGTVLTGRSSGSLNIGVAAQPVNTVYSKNAAVVTSDATVKTIAGRLTDTSYADGQKLIAALATVKPTVYQLNDSITEKGAETARYHVGYIAQDIEAAITAAGLDPSKFALWTKTAVFTVTQNADKTFKQAASKDAAGNQNYIQMLRYEEIFPVILAGLTEQVSGLISRVTALESSVKTTTGGAA